MRVNEEATNLENKVSEVGCGISKSFEVVFGDTVGSRRILYVEYREAKTGSLYLTKKTDESCRIRGDQRRVIVSVYEHSIVGHYMGDYNTETLWGQIQIGLYADGQAIHRLEKDVLGLIAKTNLPEEVKKSLGV